MLYSVSPKQWAGVGLAVCLGALAAALYLQIVLNWFPCPLCIVQRYAYLVAAIGFLGLLLVGPRSWLAKGLMGAVVLAVLGGLGTAAYHVWVLSNPMQTCGVDPLQTRLNELPWVAYWPDMFVADGLCTAEYPPLLGLSLPMWSGIGFVLLGLVLYLARRNARRLRRSW
ncbi:disulfide bond formation protein B [Limnobacter sp.]|uniref:disulfide bond formation protein B n=1 Tax=Limnobacter sp. TaxID=2003368 RepID=UPI003510EA8D